MQKISNWAVVAAIAAFLPIASMASPVLDQSNSSASNGGFCYLFGGGLCGQSFKQTNSNIAGVGFLISPFYFATDGVVTASIYSSYSSSPSGLVATGTSGTVNSNSGWVDIFWSPAALTAGDTYYMVIESAQNNGLVASFTSPASYASGNAVYAGSLTGWSSFDLAFRTYYSDAEVTVPEPLTLSLVGLGLAGVGCSRRRKA